jgi:hypothetical protein
MELTLQDLLHQCSYRYFFLHELFPANVHVLKYRFIFPSFPVAKPATSV